MRKKAWIAIIAMSLVLASCGSGAASTAENKPETESVSAEAEAESEEEEDLPEPTTQNPLDEGTKDTTPVVQETVEEAGIDAFVKLEDYHGKEFTKYVTFVTEDDVSTRVASDLELFTVEMPADTVLEDGMVADIAYVGTVDGVAFDGGTSDSYDLLIGSHTFVDDFEEQLIGARAGDEVEVIVHFPEGYSAELGGKEAHFAVTINKIKQSITEPDDEWVAANTAYATVAEYYEGIRKELQDDFDRNSDDELRSTVWEETMGSAEFLQYPQNLVDKYAAMVKEQIEYMASAYYNTTLDTFMQENGINEDYFAETGKDYVKRELVADYVLLKENVPLDTPMIEEKVSKLLELNGIATREEANAWGVSDTQLEYAALNNVAVELVIKAGTVTEVESAAEEEGEAAGES